MRITSQTIELQSISDNVTVKFSNGSSISIYIDKDTLENSFIYDNGDCGEIGYRLDKKLKEFELE